MSVLPTQMLSVSNFAAAPAAGSGAPAHLDDIAKFRQNFADAAPMRGPEQVTPVSHELGTGMKSLLSQFDSMNGQTTSLGKLADSIKAHGSDLKPGEIMDMTLKCHELVFQAELTSNVANRSSEGVQQLFRQQS